MAMASHLTQYRLRHQCDVGGCFNELYRPRLEYYKPCFDGRISMGDVDALVERRGYVLIEEYKSGRDIPQAQRRVAHEITRKPGTVYIAAQCRDVASMAVLAISVWRRGRQLYDWRESSLAALMAIHRHWFLLADRVAQQGGCDDDAFMDWGYESTALSYLSTHDRGFIETYCGAVELE